MLLENEEHVSTASPAENVANSEVANASPAENVANSEVANASPITENTEVSSETSTATSQQDTASSSSTTPNPTPAPTPTVSPTTTPTNNDPFLPGEIIKKIAMYAMTAEGGKFELTDGIGPFKPNVATGLLRANRSIYHDARRFLYSENDFVFNGCGSELRSFWGHQAGLWSCKIDGCKRVPQFKKVVIVLGDEVCTHISEMKMKCTVAALESILGDVSIKMLHLKIEKLCWISGPGPLGLVKGLSRLSVEALGMYGSDHHRHQNLLVLVQALRLDSCPTYLCTTDGFFECGHLPAAQAQ